MRIPISACLLGLKCRYDGGGKTLPPLTELLGRADLSFVPVCPEQLGGLPTPRPPAERVGERVRTRDGGDVTEQYARGAAQAGERTVSLPLVQSDDPVVVYKTLSAGYFQD